MKRLIAFLCFVFFLSLHVNSQICKSNYIMDSLINSNPELSEEILNNHQQLELFTQFFTDSLYSQNQRVAPYTIPIVFHLVHTNGLENITDEQILDGLEKLNEDFNKQNNWADVNPNFLSIAADAQIEFVLATKKLDGSCFNGITRTYSPTTYLNTQNDLIQAVQLANGNFPGNMYLNVFICADVGGSAGYTYFPSFGGTGMGNGIYILHDYVGRIGTSNFQKSTALTHNVGHWLNLQHTWGNSNDPGMASNCTTDDFVADTPNTIGWTTCNIDGESCGSLDNVENFMEYSYCSKMFTEGQKTRMHAALNSSPGGRNNLWSELNLQATGIVSPLNPDCDFTFTFHYSNPSCSDFCNGVISVIASGQGSEDQTLSYEWYFNNELLNGINSSTYSNACAGNYKVVITNSSGIQRTQIITLVAQSNTSPQITIQITPASCDVTSDGQFTANVSGGTAPYSYAWSTGDDSQVLSGLSNGFQAGLVVTDANSCQTDAGVQTMTANTVDFGLAFVANPTAGTSPLNVIFDNQTPNLSAYDFHWDFGDGLSENNNASFVTHIYSFDGLWDVTLTATDAQGCIDQLIKPEYIFTTGGVSCTHSATIQQVSPLAGCPEDNLLLTCNTSPTFTYQWLRNGSPVAGANQPEFSPTQSGSYTVRITENNCPVVSSAVQVTIHPTPATPQITGSGTIDACTGGTLTLTATAGYASYNWSNGGQSQTTQVSSSGDYTVTVANAQGCSAISLPYVVNASLMDIPTVCIVGYDDVTNSNRVIWENPVTEGIDSFYVYRETNVANQYAKLGAVAFEDLSVFTDVTANPAVQAYRYKLSVLDTCGTESALSGLHKTIHLTINQGVGQTWNLIWSHYEGIEFGSYNIYRGTNQNDLTLLTTIASNLSSYTDLAPPAGLLYYQIEVVNEDGCDPTRSFNSSKSNIVNNNEPDVSGLEEQSNWSVSLYPNPANDYVTLTLHGQVNANSLEIYDVQGRLLHSDKLTAQSTVLDVQQYQRGMYIIRVSTEKGQHELRFVKQ